MRRKRFTVLSRICPVSLKRMWWAMSASICPIWSLENRSRVRMPCASRTPSSTCPSKRMRSATRKVGGLPTSCSSAPAASVTVGSRSFSSSSSVCVHTSPSGWNSGGCATPFMAATSGRMSPSSPVSSRSSKPRRAPPSVRMRASSSRTRSGETFTIRPCSRCSAAMVAGSISEPSRAANRTARIKRRWSSWKRSSGAPMARTTRRRKSSRPPVKSSTCFVSGSSSSALIVKSRRIASCRGLPSKRDFTINALLLDPDTNQVLDFTGGREDLRRRVVRAIGAPDERFQEDHLRLIRAVRFAAGLGFEIKPATMAALQRLHGLIVKVSPERVRDELARILTEGGARRGFELLDETGLLGDILPEVAAMKGVAQPPEFHPEGDVWTHTLLLLGKLRDPTVTLAAGALLHDVGKPPTFRVAERIRFDGHVEEGVRLAHGILTRLRFSSDQIGQIEALIAHHMRFKDTGQMRESTVKRFLRMENFAEHLELHRLDCLSSNGKLDTYKRMLSRLEELGEEELRPKPLLTGRDLIELGYQPGPSFGKMLAAVEDAQLEARVQSKEAALALVRVFH